jgi:hypothetical protein
MNLLMSKMAAQANIDYDKIKCCRTDIIKGIYQTYLLTNDIADTIDSLERAVRKTNKSPELLSPI